jgi:hypothetical protein
MRNHSITLLPNGLYHVRCNHSGLQGTFKRDGTPNGGDLSYGRSSRAITRYLASL